MYVTQDIDFAKFRLYVVMKILVELSSLSCIKYVANAHEFV
jgi:hypothetical protein